MGDEYTLDYYANQVGTQNDANGTVITIREGSSGTMFIRDYNDNGQRKLYIGNDTFDYGGGSWTGNRDWWHIRVTNTGFWYNGTLITGAVDSLSGYGDGGDGLPSAITGSVTYYAGGGAGNSTGTDGTGGQGGGGNTDNSGTANTGGGGGAGNTKNGGSGVVIIRVLTNDYSSTTTGSPTVTTSGSYTVIKFTGSGTYTA